MEKYQKYTKNVSKRSMWRNFPEPQIEANNIVFCLFLTLKVMTCFYSR